jgi:hypothetical protein
MSVATSPRPRRSLLTRVFVDAEGELRGNLILAIVALAMVIVAITGTIGLMFGAAIGGDALAYWVIGAFLLVKLPVLALIWWALGRKRERGQVGGWGTRECHEILSYLERESRASLGRPDAGKRLEYFCREAWFVADNATDLDTADAVATAQRIDAMASEAGVETHRVRATTLSAGAGD